MPELTAYEAVALAVGEAYAAQVESDLANNSEEIIVGWSDTDTGEHSEVGGVGSLMWPIAPNGVLTISYENEHTTQDQIDESSEWMLQVTDHINWPSVD
jgi:hypothetical protein